MNKECYHCQDSIPAGFHAELEIAGETKEFCCYGCLAIAETIVSGGLENFYRHRTQASEKPDEFGQTQKDELSLYDDPELQADFVETKGEESETSLSISGITCAACIWLLEREINQLEGVISFSVNHTTHKAHLSWSKANCQFSHILIHIREIGYKALPYQEDIARQIAHQEKRSSIFRIAVAGIATMQNMMFSMPLYLGMYSGIDAEFISLFRWVSMLMCTPVVIFSAQPFFKAAIRDIKSRQLTMDIPVSLAILAAFLASCAITLSSDPSAKSDVYFDSVSMFTFFLLLGRFLEMQTRHKHLNSDIEMSSLLPPTAIILIDNIEVSKPAHQLQINDILVVKQGQIAAADGIVISGESRMDESALTGEFLPVHKHKDSLVTGGTANIENSLFVKITATPKHSRIASIIKLLDKAQSEKPKTVRLADKVASHFVASVLLACSIIGAYWYVQDPAQAFVIVLSVLVVTCPCALSLATPTAMTSVNTFLRKKGFLVTKAHAIEAMNEITDIIFDKTGTLTKGKLTFDEIITFNGMCKSDALEIAAGLESHSSHPIAQVFKPYFNKAADQVITQLGQGIKGCYPHLESFEFNKAESNTNDLNNKEATGKKIFNLGSVDLLNLRTKESEKISPHEGLNVYLACDGFLLAQFTLNDTLRDDSKTCIQAFQRQGIRAHILSGDQNNAVEKLAKHLGIDHYKAKQSPEQKLDYVKSLQADGRQIAMVGDGINDLPVLSGAKLSIAMGEASDITKLNSDAILLNGQIGTLNTAFQSARKTRKIIKQNISWAIIYNLCMLPLAATGLVPPYFAALGMSLSSLVVIFNSLRLKQ